MLGSGAMSNNLDDIKNAKAILVIGSNMTEAHPVVATYVYNAVQNGARLVVIDPRNTKIAKWAQLHIQNKVGSDVALLNAMMHVILEENLHDLEYVRQWVDNFDLLQEIVTKYDPKAVEHITGVSAEMVRKTARLFARSRPGMLFYTLGITEHTSGVNNVYTCANLQLLLGNIGVSGGGINPLRGQNNVQGVCDIGALPETFPGYFKVTDETARKKFQNFWRCRELSGTPGLRIPGMVSGLKSKQVRALYVFGEDPATTEPDMRHVHECLSSADFIVCNELFMTKTAEYADVIFPAAAWSESEGTFVNTERRVNLIREVSVPPGEARPNWWIFRELAKRMDDQWESTSAQQIWDHEISVLCPIFHGTSYERFKTESLQWPIHHASHPGTEYLYKKKSLLYRDVRFKDGKSRFMPVDWHGSAEMQDEEYPFVLSTGRRLYHYNNASMTKNASGLNDLLNEAFADISPGDAQRLGIKNYDNVRITSRRGSVVVRASITDEIAEGMIWMDFHFYHNNSNWITNTAADPITDTSEYKSCAVKIEYPVD